MQHNNLMKIDTLLILSIFKPMPQFLKDLHKYLEDKEDGKRFYLRNRGIHILSGVEIKYFCDMGMKT